MAPNGQFLHLSTDNFANCDDYTNTCFTPTATEQITYFMGQVCGPGELAPNTGNFQPEGNWDDLIGAPINGTWNLIISDDALGFTGLLTDWSISFSDTYLLDYQYEWSNGQTEDSLIVNALESTMYYVTIQNGLASCVDSVYVEVSNTGVTENIDFTFCSSDSIEIEVNGTIYNQNNPSGIEVFVGILPNGCDSTVVINLTFIDSDETNLNEIIFEGETFTVNSQTFNTTGNYTIPLINIYGCDSIIYLNLIVSQFNFDLISADTILTDNCDEGLYCLPLHPTQAIDYQIIVNQQIQTPPFESCSFDTTICYSALPIVNSGNYTLHEWLINGNPISFTFEDLDQLVDSMQFYDPNVNWNIPPIGNLLICADSTSNTYGNLVITNFEGDTIQLGVNSISTPNTTGILLPIGQNEVILQEIISGLSDTTFVLVNPPSISSNSVLELEVGDLSVFNFNGPIGCGNQIINAENICSELSGESAEVVVSEGDFSVTYSGISIGIDTACLLVCTESGNCDTLFIEIIVSDTMVSTIETFPEKSIKVYPNPTKNIVNIELDSGVSNGNYTLLDSNGKLIFKERFNHPKFFFESKYLPEGIYFIQIQTRKDIYYKKILVLK